MNPPVRPTHFLAALVLATGSAFVVHGAETIDSVREATMRPLEGAVAAEGPQVASEGLAGRVLCGYQGWFNCPGDGSGLGWHHWARNARQPPAPGNWNVDLLPDVGEFVAADRHATGLFHPDGTPVEVFSSLSPNVVDRHFRWMADYGIDGVFVQRFAAPLASPPHLRHCTLVLGHCREAAIRHGRVFAVMYDISGMRSGQAAAMLDDWRALRTRMRITENPAYLRVAGKPLVAVWGIGFGDGNRHYDLADCREIVAGLVADGCAVMAGVPTGWRTLDRDAVRDDRLHDVVAMCDVVSPWTVGRYASPDEVARHAEACWREDIDWCRKRSVDYLPVVFPGFSWHNLNGGPLDQIPRRKGAFLWRQFAAASQVGARSVYVAMFDECDEATAIFKCVEPPAGGAARFLGLEGVPGDHYLRLAREARKLLHAGAPVPLEPPF